MCRLADAGSMARLPRQIGYARAMELLLVGDAVAASEALAIGGCHRLPTGRPRPRLKCPERQGED
jgi:enoyl-CoA hydratase/carnithine racemase